MRSRAKERAPLLALVVLGAQAGLACGPAHVSSYTPKKRKFELAEPQAKDDALQSPGTLWHDGRPASMLFTDARALRVNDTLVIKIEEVADAHRQADTNLDHESSSAAQIDAFLGLLSKLQGLGGLGIDPNLKVGGGTKTSFRGEGKTARTEYLTATVPSTVRKVLPNGNLFVEGHRVILVNNEEQHFYISGVVRPIDIDQENSIKSSMVADAEIEFVGRGVLTDNQRQGWLARHLGWLWPF